MQIKKITSLVLAAALSISLAACGNSQTTAVTSGQDNQQAESTQTADSSEAKDPESAQAENKTEDQQAETAAENESSAGNNILILYFSADNTKDVDAVSSATPMTDGTSSVEWIANIIHDNVGGELIPIIPSEDYPLEYEALADYAKKERDDGGRPAFEDLGVDPASYDVVFVGYPIWWYEMPMIMDSMISPGRPSSLSTPMPEAVTGALTVISKNWNRMQPFWKGLRFAGRMPEKTAQRKQCFHGWRDWTWNDVLRAR